MNDVGSVGGLREMEDAEMKSVAKDHLTLRGSILVCAPLRKDYKTNIHRLEPALSPPPPLHLPPNDK